MLLLNSVVLPLALVVRDVGHQLPRLQRHLSQMAKHQEKNDHVYMEVEDEDGDGDVEVEDVEDEDEDVVAKVDQDRIKGAPVVDSKLPLVGVGVVKDVLDMALQVDETSMLLIVEGVIILCFHVIADLNFAQSHLVSCMVWWGIFACVQNFMIFVDN